MLVLSLEVVVRVEEQEPLTKEEAVLFNNLFWV